MIQGWCLKGEFDVDDDLWKSEKPSYESRGTENKSCLEENGRKGCGVSVL